MVPTRLHRHLAWLTGPADTIDLLVKDKELSRLVVTVVDPGLVALLPGSVDKVASRLEKLGRPALRVRAEGT